MPGVSNPSPGPRDDTPSRSQRDEENPLRDSRVEAERPVTRIGPETAQVDEQAIMRFNGIFRSLARSLGERQQVIYTDDVPRTVDLLAGFFLNRFNQFVRERGLMSEISTSFAISNEELFTGPNPLRRMKPEFESAITFRAGSERFESMLKFIYSEVAQSDEWRYLRKPGPYDLVTYGLFSQLFLEHLNVDGNKVVFIGQVEFPEDPKEREEQKREFSYALYQQGEYAIDHADYLTKTPRIYWVLPYQDRMSTYMGLTVPYEHIFHRPFQDWMPYADSLIPSPDEPCVGKNLAALLWHWNRCEVLSSLETIAWDLRRRRDLDQFDVETIAKICGISEEDSRYVVETDFRYDHIDDKNPWRQGRPYD